MAIQYVLADRSTTDKWAVAIADGELFWSTTTDPSNPEIEVLDGATYYTIYIDEGIVSWEVAGDENVPAILEDNSTGFRYSLSVVDGELTWTPQTDINIGVYASVDDGAWQSLESYSGYEYPLDSLGDFRKIKFRIRHNSTATQQLVLRGWEVETFPNQTRHSPADTLPDSDITVSASIDGGSWQELTGCLNYYPLDTLGKFENIKFRIRHNTTATQQLIINGWEVETFPIKVRST